MRARDLIENQFAKISEENLRSLTYDIIFILRSMLRYDKLDSQIVEKFSQVILPIYLKSDPVSPINKLKGNFLLFECATKTWNVSSPLTPEN